MMKSGEQLFLLEILIERITLRRSVLETFYPTRDFANLPLSVKVKFIDFPCFEINQQEFQHHECLTAASIGDFSTGKSCLFPMEPMELARSIRKTPLHMTLMRKLPRTCPPEILGSTDVFLTYKMCKMITKPIVSTEDTPISSILQDSYNLRNDKQEDVGFISVFVRLSCFGQSIVTQFKLVHENNSFLFKNSKEITSFECENCLCEMGDQSDTSGEQRPTTPSSRGRQDTSCPCPSDEDPSESNKRRQTYNSKDCGFDTCKNKRVTVDYEEIPLSAPQPCGRSDNVTCNMCGSSPPKDCGPSYPCGIICDESRQPKSSDCEPMHPCAKCGNRPQSKSSDSGLTYPCGICGKVQNKSKDYPCGVCGQSSIPKSQDCGPTYSCGECGLSTQKKSDAHGPASPCGVCGSIFPNKSHNLVPNYPCGVCSSGSKKSSRDCGPLYPCGTCSTPQSAYKDKMGTSYGESPVRKQQTCSKCLQKRSKPSRQPLISGDECGITQASQCPGEQESCGLPCCECGEYIDEPEDNYYDDNVCDICPECFDVLRPPFSERGEDDIVPVMPQYSSQHNIYDPELDQKTCAAKVQKKSEKWQEMLKCNCDNEHLTEMYEKLQAEEIKKPINPAIRYDTTGCLSPAYGGKYEPEELIIYPNIRYDTTGALSAAHNHPPIRYDTTGALSSAYQGGDPTLIYDTSRTDYPELRETESTPGMIESTAIDPAFQGTGMEKQTYSEALVAAMAKRKKRRKCWRPPPKSLKKYGYTWGGTYPGIKIGHRFCVDSSGLVPARMGWTWDKSILGLKFRPGWRPGAINRKVINIMRSVKKAAGLKLIPLSKKGGASGEAETYEKNHLPPTLHIHRRDGAYYISMHPMNLEPEENNVPLQFRIPAKKKDEEDEGDSCVCDSDSSSDLEIEFMAPGVYWPSDKDKKAVHTQCFESEFPPDLEQELLLDLQARGTTVPEGKDKKIGKKDTKGKGVTPNKNVGIPGVPDADISPKIVGWDRDNIKTAVGRKK